MEALAINNPLHFWMTLLIVFPLLSPIMLVYMQKTSLFSKHKIITQFKPLIFTLSLIILFIKCYQNHMPLFLQFKVEQFPTYTIHLKEIPINYNCSNFPSMKDLFLNFPSRGKKIITYEVISSNPIKLSPAFFHSVKLLTC